MKKEGEPSPEPQEKPAEEPAPATEDDPFAPAAKESPKETPTVEKPADEKPAEEPAEEPSTKAEDDLFGEPADNKPEMKDEEPKSTEEKPAPAAEEDLFGTPEPEAPAADEKATNEKPADEKPADASAAEKSDEKPSSDDKESSIDDLFKDSSFRTWKDNTGSFTVRAKLVVIYGNSVRLLKENGRYTTVSFKRLSEKDRSYVSAVLARLSDDAKTELVEFSDNNR
jgi:hypothetical protein